MKKEIFGLGITLCLFAAGACVALSLVYTVTGPTIAGLEQAQLEATLKDLFPEADSFEELNGVIKSENPGVYIQTSWKATRDRAVIGLAVKGSASSYGGDAAMLVGVGIDKKIVGARVVSLSDTPGLGANASNLTYFVDKQSKTTFPGQFSGKAVIDPFEVKNDVIAISASTITSKALTSIVKEAGLRSASWLDSNGGAK